MDQASRRSNKKNNNLELPKYMQSSKSATSSKSRANAKSGTNSKSQSVKNTKSSGEMRVAPKSGVNTAKTAAKRKQKETKAQKLMRYAIIAFGSLVAVICAVLLLNRLGGDAKAAGLLSSNKTFYEGIKVEGVDVGGMQADEAKPLVQKAINEKLSSVSIAIITREGSVSLTAADMGASSDIDTALSEALSFGRGGSLSENADDKEQLTIGGKEFNAKITVDTEKLIAKLNSLAQAINEPAVEPHAIPSLSEDNVQSFEFVDGANGKELDADSTAGEIARLLNEGRLTATVEPIYNAVEPTMTMAFIKENTKKIASFTTRYARSSSDEVVKNRCFNIEKTANLINCHSVAPNEEFTFNGWVGPRTLALGWKEAPGISGGKEYTAQPGGGICQVSTTLYGALLRSNIKVTDRKKHSIPSSYVPKGLDATVDTSGIDLKFLNDTGAPIYIFAYITPDPESSRRLNVTVSIYGKPLPDGITYEPVSEIIEETERTDAKYEDDPTIPVGYQLVRIEARSAFVAEVYLEKKQNGAVVERIYLHTDKYNGNNAHILIGTGDPATVTAPAEATLIEPIGGQGTDVEGAAGGQGTE